MTAPELAKELTAEQKALAAELAQAVMDYEAQGSLATFKQARALLDIRSGELYRAIQKPDGGNYGSFGEYVVKATTKSPATISQNISVVSAFSGFSDDKLIAAGPEKLYIAWKMFGDNLFPSLDAALEAASTMSRADLMATRKSNGTPSIRLVPLADIKVTQGQADRFLAAYETKYRAAYVQVHNDTNPSDSAVTDFVLDVFAGLPSDFLLSAAAGEGGAAPEMEGGFRPMDITPEDAIFHIGEVILESGGDPTELLAKMEVGFQSLKDRYEIKRREAEEAALDASKKEREAKKQSDKWTGRIQKAPQNSVIVFADGAEALIIDTNADNGNGIQEVWLRAMKDGSENIFHANGAEHRIADIARLGIVELKKPAPAPKPKAEKPVKAAPEKKASVAKADKPEKAAKEAASKLGMSKAEQAAKGKKTPKVSKPAEQSAEA